MNGLTDCNCQLFSSHCSNPLFASPSEICHWNSAVWDPSVLTPPDSPEGSLEETSSQSADSSLFSCDSMSAYSMDHSTYAQSLSPETRMEPMPESDYCQNTGWTDQLFLPGHAPFSPVLSDTNQSSFTVPTSEVSFSSLGPSAAKEYPVMDGYSNAWTGDAVGDHFFVEPTVAESDMFSFSDHSSENAQSRYRAWYTPTEATRDSFFTMDCQGQAQNYAPVLPQTAAFVGNPVNTASQTGFNTSGFCAGHSRVDSLYSQAGQQNVVVGHNHIVSEAPVQEISGPMPPRRMTMAVHQHEPIQAIPSGLSEPDVPYGAPIQQYRTYAPGFPSVLPIAGAYGSPDIPVLGSNASVPSMASSIAPGVVEESPRSPASSVSTSRTKIEDSDGRARTDPLYSAKPHADGAYRCPFVNTEACQHKPTKLKCNYDKYIDSHIKPFRCKHSNCNNNRFSSTACLLRHEREAHGLHGHGNKPFLCEFQDCDRSAHNNGFPRAYNLYDHMKRVHSYQPDKSNKTSPAQSATRVSGRSQDKTKKRRTSGEPSQRGIKKETVSPKLAARKSTAEWQTRIIELQQKLQRMQDPHAAAAGLQRMSEELAELQRLSRQFG